MPKLLQKSLWKYLINMTIGTVGMMPVWILLDWIIGRDGINIFLNTLMCVPFMHLYTAAVVILWL